MNLCFLRVSRFHFALCGIFIWGCQPSVKELLIEKIESECRNFDQVSSCTISIKDFTDFAWEKMYVFSGPAEPENMSKALGFSCNCSFLPDDCMRLVFINDQNVVHVEDYSVDSYKRLQFRALDWLNDKIPVYTPSSARFYVLRRPNELNQRAGGYLYDLFPLEGSLKPRY